jgi:hypothetical protein
MALAGLMLLRKQPLFGRRSAPGLFLKSRGGLVCEREGAVYLDFGLYGLQCLSPLFNFRILEWIVAKMRADRFLKWLLARTIY